MIVIINNWGKNKYNSTKNRESPRCQLSSDRERDKKFASNAPKDKTSVLVDVMANRGIGDRTLHKPMGTYTRHRVWVNRAITVHTKVILTWASINLEDAVLSVYGFPL